MFGFDDAKDNYQQVYQDDVPEEHKAKWSHELIAGAAAFEGMKQFEDRQRRNGETVNHSFAKELLSGFAAAEVDKLAETKGLNFIDKEEAKHKAKKNARELYDQHYGDQDQYSPDIDPPRQIQEYQNY